VKVVETLIHGQRNVTDIVFFILWNISFLLILALDSNGKIKNAQKSIKSPWNALTLYLSLSLRDK